jgi:hypothetical protein
MRRRGTPWSALIARADTVRSRWKKPPAIFDSADGTMRSIWILGHTGSLQATLSAGVFGKWERFEPKQGDCCAFALTARCHVRRYRRGLLLKLPRFSFLGCGAYRANGGKFEIVQTIQLRHSTPWDPEQRFQFSAFRRF